MPQSDKTSVRINRIGGTVTIVTVRSLWASYPSRPCDCARFDGSASPGAESLHDRAELVRAHVHPFEYTSVEHRQGHVTTAELALRGGQDEKYRSLAMGEPVADVGDFARARGALHGRAFSRAAASLVPDTYSVMRATSDPRVSKITIVGSPSTRYFSMSSITFGSSSLVAST